MISKNNMLALALLIASVFLAPAHAEPLTTPAAKQTFLATLQSRRADVRQATQKFQADFQQTAVRMREIATAMQQLHAQSSSDDFPPDGNRRAAGYLEQVVCDADIGVTMGIQQHQYYLGWQYFKQWAESIQDTLGSDPVENPHLWYGRYDFYRGIEVYDTFIDILYRKRRAFIIEICRELNDGFFGPFRDFAARLDQNNADGKALIEQLNAANAIEDETRREAEVEDLQSQIDALKRRGEAEKAQMDSIAASLRSTAQRRSVDMIDETNRAIEKLKTLEVPERGRISGTSPDRIRFRNRRQFSVTLRGNRLPRGLTAADIGSPAGLQLLGVSGGGDQLYLRFAKNDQLRAGRHSIKIAGEPVPFTFDDSEETSISVSQPLVESGTQLPTGTGSVPEDGKGTFLTADALLDNRQQRRGYWQAVADPPAEEASPPYHFENFRDAAGQPWFVLKGVNREPDHYEDLVAHQSMDLLDIAAKGVVGQYDRRQGDCYGGLRSTKEVPKPDGTEVCPTTRWWEPANLCFDSNNLTANEAISGKTHDEESCETQDTPSNIEVKYERFVGLSFAPFQAGKYIHTLTVTTPGAFKVSVGLEWDYSLLEPSRLELTIRDIKTEQTIKEFKSNLAINNSGNAHIFSTPSPGQYSFEIRVYDYRNRVIHRDRAVAILDR